MNPFEEFPSSYDEDGVQWAWDATSIIRASECPRKYYYMNIEGWALPPSVHLWFGGHYAKALETFHELEASGIDRETAIRTVVLETIKATWKRDLDSDGNPIPGSGAPDTFNEPKKTRETLIRTIIWYFDTFAEEFYRTYITTSGSVGVEHSFRLNFDEGITYCGHLDRVCLDPEDNFFVHDQKTTGSTLSSYYFKSFKPSIQFAGYTFAGKAIYDVPIKGVIVDAAQVVIGFSAFARIPILFTDEELDEWYDETISIVLRMQQYTRERHFPRNTTACGNYGGCPFRDVCSRPPNVRKNFLKADFVKQEPWNPIKPR